ncbi:MAG: aminotransferase class III-fold pyridoxal phosphate-dependent enzyme, partial [Thermoplasmata archaeon]
FKKGYKEEKGYKVIHLREAFHGRSGYTLSLTNTFDPRKTQYFPKFNWPRITNPKITFPLSGENIKKVEELEKKSLDEMEKAIKENPDDIAAFIIEPIQGEGGDNHFRKEYFKEVEKITKKNEIMFIVDEVQSGMGITGKWWAHQHFDVKPDIIAFGKKMHVCGIMVGPRIDEIEDNVFKVSSRINSTWGGNLADMVAGKKILEIMDEEKLVDNAAKMGEIFVKGLLELQEKYTVMNNARGRGLMDAFDLKDTKTRDVMFELLYKNGLLALKTGEKGIRFRPPLVVGNTEVTEALNRIEKSLKEL